MPITCIGFVWWYKTRLLHLLTFKYILKVNNYVVLVIVVIYTINYVSMEIKACGIILIKCLDYCK